jgi:hypothetical protein
LRDIRINEGKDNPKGKKALQTNERCINVGCADENE